MQANHALLPIMLGDLLGYNNSPNNARFYFAGPGKTKDKKKPRAAAPSFDDAGERKTFFFLLKIILTLIILVSVLTWTLVSRRSLGQDVVWLKKRT